MSTAHLTERALRLDFHLDLICPWCWIGLRHLRTAWSALRAQRPAQRLALHWHAQPLLPDIPPQGVPYQAFYLARLGSAQAVAARRAQVQAMANAAGLQIAFERIQTFPNTRLACALVGLAQEQQGSEAMFALVEAIFEAYFVQGRDIGSATVLLELAEAAGLMVDAAQWQGGPSQAMASSPGGVPHLVIAGQWAVTGARPAAELLPALLRCADAIEGHSHA
jgi:predicted DsbA family dithiol-disulfide isomerase